MRTNAPSFERSDVVFIQQGSSGTLRVENESRWYVIKEERQGSRLLNSIVLSSHHTEQEAGEARDTHKAAAELGRRGGRANTEAQNKARAANGKLGGRPKKTK